MLHRLGQGEDRSRWTRSRRNPGPELKGKLLGNREEREVEGPKGGWDALSAKSMGETVRTWNGVDRELTVTGCETEGKGRNMSDGNREVEKMNRETDGR